MRHYLRTANHRALRLRPRTAVPCSPSRIAFRGNSGALGAFTGHKGEHVPRQPANVPRRVPHSLECNSRQIPQVRSPSGKNRARLTLCYKVLDSLSLFPYPLPMPFLSPLRSTPRDPIPIDARAADHLRYIRETMERAVEFTAVPGWGGVAMGLTALVASWIASRQASPRDWLPVWLVEAFVAVAPP